MKLSSGHPGFIKSVLPENMALFSNILESFGNFGICFGSFGIFFGKIPDIFDKVGKTKTNLMSMMNIVTALGAEDNRILPSENS